MREIKFRAWDRTVAGFIYLEITSNPFEPIQYKRPLGHRYFKEMPIIIWQQYTGLKDKNGVEIYEGDIVQTVYDKNDKGDTYEIVYELGGLWKNKVGGRDGVDVFGFDRNEKYLEVIGNIYENKELLK